MKSATALCLGQYRCLSYEQLNAIAVIDYGSPWLTLEAKAIFHDGYDVR